MYLEGRHAVFEALDAGLPLEEILVADGMAKDKDKTVERIVKAAGKANIPVKRVKRARLDELSDVHGAHQGVMAKAAPYRYAHLRDIVRAAEGREDALIVVLDHVVDPGNLGAIARSAEVVGACGLVIPNRRAAQVTPLAWKASAGALGHLKVANVPNLAACVDELKEEGFWVVGASEHAEQTIWDAPLDGRIALVMGSEGSGISRLVLEHCDILATLPQAGTVESLNVAQASTAVMYEWLRRTWGKRS